MASYTLSTSTQTNNRFEQNLARYTHGGLFASSLTVLQVNIGLRCNLQCQHCHVISSPKRSEEMSWQTMQEVVCIANHIKPRLVDITGGAPEMHPRFKDFVLALKLANQHVQVRTNLTIFFEAGYEWLPDFFKAHNIELVASLPCYLENNVNAQRGPGVYSLSIAALKKLNALGYGQNPALPLHLVYNPGGASLPPEQRRLENDYRRELRARHGIEFTDLYTIANMPIGRWRAQLKRQNKLESYLQTLQAAFNPATLDGLMCRHQIEVAWDGTLYDCDFNLAEGVGLTSQPRHIRDFDAAKLRQRRIATRDYCFGCTAGAGSSCGGALV